MKITILGCGPSTGVPLITGEWGRCNPQNLRNIRRRSSIIIQKNGKNILIDAGPDIRMQLLDAGITHIDAVILTHAHADHIRGLDDLKIFALKQEKAIPIYGDKITLSAIETCYHYALKRANPLYSPFLELHFFSEQTLKIDGIDINVFPQKHGKIISWGIRILDFAYSTDFNDLPTESIELLKGVKYWIAECLGFEPHPSHSCLSKTLEMIDIIKPIEAILTHMNYNLDYDELINILPKGIRPAYDGMIIEIKEQEFFVV